MQISNPNHLHVHLKCHAKFYDDLVYNRKKAEYRKNDRHFKVGDVIAFLFINDSGKIISDRPAFTKEITHITSHDDFDKIPEDYVMLSLE